MGRTSTKEFNTLTNRCNCRKHCFNMLEWDIDDLSFDPNIICTKYEHAQVKKKRKHNDLVRESIPSSAICARHKSI